MRKIATSMMLLGITVGMAAGGTIAGRLVFECTEPTSAQGIAAVLTEGQMRALAAGSLDYSSLAYTLVAASPWTFEINSDFSDDSSYYAFGLVVVNDSTLEGNPMGIYPYSPFHTADGDYEGVEIPVDDTVDITIHLTIDPELEFSNIYALVLDISQGLFSGTGELDTDLVAPITDTLAVVENVPSGLKQIVIFKDENGNEFPDEEEPQTFCVSLDTPFVFAAAGVPASLEPQAHLSLEKVSEIKPEMVKVKLYPSPFNSELFINAHLPEGKYELQIEDISGKVVYETNIYGNDLIKWNASSEHSGIYLVKISGNGINIVKRVMYLK